MFSASAPTARAAAKARTPTSAPGSDRRTSGFTLLELLIVVTLVALASTVAVLSLPDPTIGRLEREATRLASLFETARARARALGVAVRWVPVAGERAPDAPDFRFIGLPDDVELPTRWLEPGVAADIADPRGVLLGPEPVIGAQRVVLRVEDRHLTIATDGLGPFVTTSDAAASAPGS